MIYDGMMMTIRFLYLFYYLNFEKQKHILLLQMDAEERWMATQGESSEFAMNTLTSGPFSDYTSRR